MLFTFLYIFTNFIQGAKEGYYNIPVITNSSEAWKMRNEGDKFDLSVAYFDFINDGYGVRKITHSPLVDIIRGGEYDGVAVIDKSILEHDVFYEKPLRILLRSKEGKVIFISKLMYKKDELIDLPESAHLPIELFIYIFYLINHHEDPTKIQYLDSSLQNVIRHKSGSWTKSEFVDASKSIIYYVISNYPFLIGKWQSLDIFMTGDVDFITEEWSEYFTIIKATIGMLENNIKFKESLSKFIEIFTNYILFVSDADLLVNESFTREFNSRDFD